MPAILESIQVWVVPLVTQNTERWQPVLTAAEWEKALRFRLPADRKRFTVTRGVLKTLLGRYLERTPNEIAFTENANGKYALPDATIEFNVSHSGDYALLAFARETPLGVDVELIKDDGVIKELSRRVLTPGEYARFTSIDHRRRGKTFFQIWTLKESLLKGIGSGLSVAPECIEIAFFPDAPRLLAADTDQIEDVNDWTLRSFAIGDRRYAAAIAVKDKSPVIEIKTWVS